MWQRSRTTIKDIYIKKKQILIFMNPLDPHTTFKMTNSHSEPRVLWVYAGTSGSESIAGVRVYFLGPLRPRVML